MFDAQRVKNEFPIFKQKIKGKPLAYLDNAATTQKPRQVLAAMDEFYVKRNANVHRAVYSLGEQATLAYECAREKVAHFIGARATELVFTRNTTEAINLVATSFASSRFGKRKSVISTIMEHHSNFVPWQQLAERGFRFKVVDLTEEGALDYAELERDLGQGEVGLVAVVHASNTLGAINDVRRICRLAKKFGALSLVDGAQSVPHLPVDVKTIGCDFLAFSGHKMLGPTGIGVLYARTPLLEELPPMLFGGDMISEVSLSRSSWNTPPWKFEAGTPNVAGAVGLGAACDYLSRLGLSAVFEHGSTLAATAIEELEKVPGLEVYGPSAGKLRCGLVSFNVEGIHAHDLASVLDGEGIAIRSGSNCTQPLLKRLGVSSGAVARASFYVYNTPGDVERLAAGVKKTVNFFLK